jgi:large subunit ribosomal protein L10
MRTKQQKRDELTALREKVARAPGLVVANYRGLSVAEARELRSRLQAAGNTYEYRVAKNTLLRLAVKGTSAEGIAPKLVGPTAVAFAYAEPAALAKALVDYAKEHEKFEIKGGVIDGAVVDLAEVRALAALPSKNELRATLMATLRSPLQSLAGTLAGLLGGVRNALEQRRKQLET